MGIGAWKHSFGENLPSVNLDVQVPMTCALGGHQIESWSEYLDGQCVGNCSVCMQRVISERPPGGLPFIRLKALIECLIATPDNMALVLEMQEITSILEAEQRALEDAKALLATAKEMIECQKD